VGFQLVSSSHLELTSIYLACDEVMTGLKCPNIPFFSLMYHGISSGEFLLDFISFGKSFLMSGVVAVNMSDKQVGNLRCFIGEATSVIDAARR